MLNHKFLSFKPDPFKKYDFADKKKWSTDDGRVYKLVNADLKKDVEHVTAEISLKEKAYAPDEKLWIGGIANANIVDRTQERLDPRGLDVLNYMKNKQLLAHHSYYHPIGQVEQLDVQEDGVHFLAWIGDPARAPLTEMQQEIRSLVAQGVLRTVSVGFIPQKIRAPLYDNNGALQEPMVIESWELLEISIVAIPCNQGSVFEVRAYTNDDEDGKVKQEKNDTQVKPENNSVELASELTETINSEKPNKNLKVQGCSVGVKNDSSQGQSTENSKAPATDAPPPADDALRTQVGELITLARTTGEQVQNLVAMVDQILVLVQNDAAEDQSEDTGGATPGAQLDAAKTAEDRITENEKAVKDINSKIVRLVDTVKLLAEKIVK